MLEPTASDVPAVTLPVSTPESSLRRGIVGFTDPKATVAPVTDQCPAPVTAPPDQVRVPPAMATSAPAETFQLPASLAPVLLPALNETLLVWTSTVPPARLSNRAWTGKSSV